MLQHLFILLFCTIFVKTEFVPFRGYIEGEISAGMYWMDVHIGSPSQTLRLHIDTGSNLMILESSSCSTCKPHFSGYSNSKSNSSQSILCSSSQCDANSCYTGRCADTSKCSATKCCYRGDISLCGFYVAYGDGSKAEGGLVRDTMSIQNKQGDSSLSVMTTFGSIATESGTWSDFSDGLLGLAYDNLYCSPTCYKTWVDEYYEATKASGARDIFGMCLGETSGILSLGGIDTDLFVGSIYWVDVQNPSFYSLRMKGFHIGTVSISISVSNAIIDSGTTLLLLPPSMYEEFVLAIQSNYPNAVGITGEKNLFNGYAVSTNPSNSWPPLFVSFDGVVIRIPPSVYFLRLIHNGIYYYALGITSGTSSYILLGDSFMRGLNILHDRENDLIGFTVPSETCFEGAYSILNYYDPREDKWYNDTTHDIPESSPWDDLIDFCKENLLELLLLCVIILLIMDMCCSCCCRKNVPVRVKKQAKKNSGVKYNRGFDTKQKDETLTTGEVIEMRTEVPHEEETTQPKYVLARPVYIQPVAPPKPTK